MRKFSFTRFVEKIYEYLKKSRVSVILFPPQVSRDLKALNQSEKMYYVQKLTYVISIFLFVFLLIIVYVKNSYVDNASLNYIARPSPDGQSEDVVLQLDGKQTYHMKVSPRILTEEEAEQEFQSLVSSLETYILGENESVMEITENLKLPEKVEPYPFDIYWESEKEYLIDALGTVYRKNLKEDTLVTLTAICTYMEYQWEHSVCVRVMKETLSDEEQYERMLEQYLIEDEEKQQFSEAWKLPESFQGNQLQFKSLEQLDTVLLLAMLVFATGIGLWFGKNRDVRQNRRKRQQMFEEEYLNFVSSLSLYISAGLNLQMAMKHCVKDYTTRKPAKNVLRTVLTEFEKDIINGYSFQNALEKLADRTDHIYYRRLAGLLHQGLLNGTYELARTLQEEVDKIREDKRRQCKVKGEKISTALIVPMMLELCVVIAFIMFPAFSTMQF